jgi:hypothetical protein
MEQTLEQKIIGILQSFEDNVTELDTAIDNFKYPDLAKELHKLFIQEKIDLLERLVKKQNPSPDIRNEITILLNQL